MAGAEIEDNQWGFGQIAALFTWAAIPVEISYKLNGGLYYARQAWKTESTNHRPSGRLAEGTIPDILPIVSLDRASGYWENHPVQTAPATTAVPYPGPHEKQQGSESKVSSSLLQSESV